MANNRIYLVHAPTGKRIKLGKRMAMGYYSAPSGDALQAFFDECERSLDDEYEPDAFVLEYEMEPNTI